MAVFPIDWHETNLQNMVRYVEAEERNLQNYTRRVERLRLDCLKYKQQIDRAISLKKEGFDPERFRIE